MLVYLFISTILLQYKLKYLSINQYFNFKFQLYLENCLLPKFVSFNHLFHLIINLIVYLTTKYYFTLFFCLEPLSIQHH